VVGCLDPRLVSASARRVCVSLVKHHRAPGLFQLQAAPLTLAFRNHSGGNRSLVGNLASLVYTGEVLYIV